MAFTSMPATDPMSISAAILMMKKPLSMKAKKDIKYTIGREKVTNLPLLPQMSAGEILQINLVEGIYL